MSVQTPASSNCPGLLKRLFTRTPNPTFDQYADLLKRLEAERAQSAKLIEALKFFATMSMTYKGQEIEDPRKQRAVDAIAEYEND